MKLIFELSGENPTLPFAELECIGSLLDRRLQVAVAECPHPAEAHRLAMTQGVLEYLGECDPTPPAFQDLLRDLSLETSRPFAGRTKKVHGGCHERNPQSQREFENLIGTMVTGPVSLNHPEVEFRAILSEDKCYFGRVLFTIDRSAYDVRNPGKRDFFHPGVMMPRMARTLVNLACARKGDILLDPFCGTGGLLIEAGMLGFYPVGCDFDRFMIQGSIKNSPGSLFLQADATSLPFRDRSIDTIVTDFPYGQSVCIRKTDTMDRLYTDALEEIRRLIRPGRRAIVVTHRDISAIASRYMTVLQNHDQRVHKSLTRRVLVLGS
ncbi:methyltransferase domain-containing protein [Methanoregula sp.]|uniref:methyltransferase domain-containing protein n=1 Tax=Methanoregula sp. TaxID=2052170 RepID=UPI003C754FDE